MCGIVSVGGQPIDPAVLQRMNDRLAHRGPDGAGFLVAWSDGERFGHAVHRQAVAAMAGRSARVGLRHRRLAILDLSDRGLQPMAAPGGDDIWIVFNGEIYNHLELQAELRALGHTFTTRTDTEVLLQDVFVRHLGRAARPPLLRTRPSGHQAVLLRDAGGLVRLRLGNQVTACVSRAPGRAR